MTNSPVKTDDQSGPLERFEAASDGPDQTQRIAGELAMLVKTGDLLVLTGDLGAGKTCFTQGLGIGLGIAERITSPTFTLANQYQGRLLLHHLDVYRLDSVTETLDLDLPDLLHSGVTVIEWGERISDVLPNDYLLVRLRYPDVDLADVAGGAGGTDYDGQRDDEFDQYDDRIIEFVANGSDWQDRLRTLAARLGVDSGGS